METNSIEKSGTFVGSNGRRIFYRNWRVEYIPKAIVLIIHGLNSHSGYYENFAAQLNHNGFQAYAIDLVGRGHSEGERYYISDYWDIIADIDVLYNIAAAHSERPIFLLGHSAGGVFASIYAILNQTKLKGLISESFAYRVPAPGIAVAFIKLISRFFPHTKLVQLNIGDFSRDRSVIEKMESDPLLVYEKQQAKTMQQLF